MRFVAITLFAGFVFSVAEPSVAPELPMEKVGSSSKELISDPIDPIVTGKRITPEHLKAWEDRRKRYLECPSCVASQPYPGD